MTTDTEHRAFLRRLRGDLRNAAKELEVGEARYLVDLYYQIQEFRKASKNQVRSSEEPNALITWVGMEFKALEGIIKETMDHFTDQHVVTRWAKSLFGIGPVLTAGFFAHIDITKAPTYSSIWRYAGLDPSAKWGKKQKRPWNARLKVLAWKFGDCQVKFSGNEKCFYGQLYKQKKQKLIEQNEELRFKDAAAEGAARVGKETEAYKSYKIGKLPTAHVHARACRWVSKLFLAHWHEVAFKTEFNRDPPNPYAISILGHDPSHKIEVPNAP